MAFTGDCSEKEVPLYGSSRLGQESFVNKGIRLDPPGGEEYIPFKFTREKNNKRYELSNHLGNVLAVVSDQKECIPSVATNWFADYYDAKVVSANDYYPFGMQMPGRTHSSPSYRYGFNGKEKDESGEWGDLTHYDYGFRIYNAGIARFLSEDPLTSSFPWYTPYQFAGNKPIVAVDLDGLEEIIVHSAWWTEKLLSMAINGSTAEEIASVAESANNDYGGKYGGFKNEGSQSWAGKHYGAPGVVTTIGALPEGEMTITGFTNVTDGDVLVVHIASVTMGGFIDGTIKLVDPPSPGVIEKGLGEISKWKDALGEKLGHDDTDITLDEAMPIMFGTVSVVGGILTLGGSAYLQGTAATTFAIWNGGGGVAFGLDAMTVDENGETFVERVILTGDEAQAIYNGTKTLHSITNTIGSGAKLIGGQLEAAIGFMNSLNSLPKNANKTLEDANSASSDENR